MIYHPACPACLQDNEAHLKGALHGFAPYGLKTSPFFCSVQVTCIHFTQHHNCGTFRIQMIKTGARQQRDGYP